MVARLMVIAAVALTIGTSAVADPPKAPARDSVPPASTPAKVVLASAEEVQAPAPAADQQAPTAPKRRAARVTTCRCGDPQPEQQ
jgi:hypothetical protein